MSRLLHVANGSSVTDTLALTGIPQFRQSAMPYLGRALERFLENYPSTRDGLSRSERRLLQLAAMVFRMRARSHA